MRKMIEAKFTPGNWIVSENDELPCVYQEEDEEKPKIICEAITKYEDAYLIAAAPEMFKILIATKNILQSTGTEGICQTQCLVMSEILEYTLELATGERRTGS